MRARRLGLGIALVFLLVLLPGCGGGGEKTLYFRGYTSATTDPEVFVAIRLGALKGTLERGAAVRVGSWRPHPSTIFVPISARWTRRMGSRE